ncbi:merozoite surface protein 1 [Methylorubrum populi]|uniref:Merozoite surface protein 1 n=1 Tax=Methylorubrum populi TaxID=223967 RepID=A0A160PIP4_9HYPH|nr:merozoite surface protein 1 [Methylorubrum populi]
MAPVAAMPPMAVVMVAVAPAMVVVTPVAAMVTPVPVMMVAMPPMAVVMAAVAEMMMVPLHRLDRRLRCQGRRRSRRQRGGVGDCDATEKPPGHQRECGEREARATG